MRIDGGSEIELEMSDTETLKEYHSLKDSP